MTYIVQTVDETNSTVPTPYFPCFNRYLTGLPKYLSSR